MIYLFFFSFPFRIFNGLDGMEIVNTGSASKLTFFNVSDGDYGNYTCIATNLLGSSNTSFLLYGEISFIMRITILQLKYIKMKQKYNWPQSGFM